MKKYNINNIFVVEVENGNDIRYLICIRNRLRDSYTDILTSKKINVDDDFCVEPLTNYYPILGQQHHENGKPLMLDKAALLNYYTSINNEASFNATKKLILNSNVSDNIHNSNNNDNNSNNNNNEQERILELATLNFFPENGSWMSGCFRKPSGLIMDNLPCHLSDDLWLARMLKHNQKLLYVSIRNILDFVKNSPYFQEKRHEYEQEIVKWQINWMRNYGDNWINDDTYGGDFTFLTSVCDLGFRKGVVDTLSKIGMSTDAIEEGLEKNANLWRDFFMEMAFDNEYSPISPYLIAVLEDDSSEERKMLEPVDPEHKEKWLKMRKYEYYQRHKASVDKYGVVDPDMLLSDDEVVELKTYLEQKHAERMMQIEHFRQDGYEVNNQPKVFVK